MRIAYVQMKIEFGDKEANLRHAADLIAACPADLYVLPELCNTGYLFASRRQTQELAELIPQGPTCQFLADLTRRHNCFLVAGMAEKTCQSLFNSAALFGPHGFIDVYRKIHLFDEEKICFDPGDKPWRIHDLGMARIGMMICFDWMFPEAMRTLALAGADIVCHAANLVMPYCQDAMITRCLENGVFAVTANRVGQDSQGEKSLSFTGKSQIVAPRGVLLHRAGEREPVVFAMEIDPALARVKLINARNDLLGDRRPEFYRISTNPDKPAPNVGGCKGVRHFWTMLHKIKRTSQ